MTALPTDFSVTSNRGAPTPSPDWPIDSPFAVTAVSAASVSDPSALSSIATASLSGPAALLAVSASSISTPTGLGSVDAADVLAPASLIFVAESTVTTPAALATKAESTVTAPAALTTKAESTVVTPSSLGTVSESAVGSPVGLSNVSEAAIVAASYSPESVVTITAPSALAVVSISTVTAPSAYSSVAESTVGSPSALSSVSESSVSTPTAKTTVAKATVATPTALTATSGTATTPPFPLNHARILYDNLLFNYDSVAITDGTNGNYALIPNTYKGWEFTHDGSTTVSWTLTMPANVNMDTFCIGAHNLADIGATVEVFYDVDATAGGLISVGSATPTNGTPLMFHLSSSVSVRRVKLEIDSAVAGNIKIGYISAGIALQLQRPFFGGHTPITMGDNSVYRNNMTDGGEFTSRSIIRKGFSNSVSIENVDRTWIQNYFLDFKEVSKEYLYFIAWNLLEYPEEVGLCMTGGDISLQFSGTRDLMSINWSQAGHGSV